MVIGRVSTLARKQPRARDVRMVAASMAVMGLGACSTVHMPGAHPVPPPPPPPPRALESHSAPLQSPPPSASLPKGCADEKCARKVVALHRQYFDQRHRRYYFYDPARRAYFWEDGSPK